MTLFLTDAESAMYAILPAAIRGSSVVTPEDLTSYETDAELATRAGMVRFERYPELTALVADMQAGKVPDALPKDLLPAPVFADLLFVIGARGMTDIIARLLAGAASAEDVAVIAPLTELRHRMLLTNASSTTR